MAVEQLTSKLLDSYGFIGGFTKRTGNLTTKVSPLTNSDIKHVSANLRLIQEQLLNDQTLAVIYLEGGDKVVSVARLDGSATIYGCDGAATGDKLALGLEVADCVPILLADPKSGLIGVAHGGWKGLAGGVASKVVHQMEQLGAKPADILASLGPSICVNCYEVGEEVATQFDESVVKRGTAKPHLDLWAESTRQLNDAGVEQIENLQICTYENTDQFYSARQEGRTGRFLGYVSKR